MVVYLVDQISGNVIKHQGVKVVRAVSNVHKEEFIELVFRTKVERYPSKYYFLSEVR